MLFPESMCRICSLLPQNDSFTMNAMVQANDKSVLASLSCIEQGKRRSTFQRVFRDVDKLDIPSYNKIGLYISPALPSPWPGVLDFADDCSLEIPGGDNEVGAGGC